MTLARAVDDVGYNFDVADRSISCVAGADQAAFMADRRAQHSV